MIFKPQIGQKVQIWYRKELIKITKYHSFIGIIENVSNSSGPINVLITINKKPIIVPRGNIREIINKRIGFNITSKNQNLSS